MARCIGTKNLHYALLTSDGSGIEPMYDSMEKIPKVINFKTTDNYAEYTFYSEDGVEETGKKLVSVEIEIEVGYIGNKLKSDITGVTYDPTTGKTYKNSNMVQPAIAIAYEMTKSAGAPSDYRVLYKCNLSIDESESTTTEDGIESNNFVLKGIAVPLSYNGNVDMEINGEEVAEGAQEVINNFFTEIQL